MASKINTENYSQSPARLHVNIIRATNVVPSDPGGKADPYCLIYLLGANESDRVQRTEVKYATLEPVWEERFVLQIKELEPFMVATGDEELELHGYLVIDTWDKDSVNPDDFLGRVMISLREIPTDPESPKDVWYDLTRRTPKDSVTGQLCARVELEVDGGKVMDWNVLNNDLYRICQSHGFHLPLHSGKTLVEIPGRTEHVEMAFSHVFVDISSHHCTAQVYITNYRLIIIAMRDVKTRSHHGREAAVDLSMWIALNNIMSTEVGTETIVVRRQLSGQKRKSKTTSISIHCFDARIVKLIFLLEEDMQDRSRSKSPEGIPLSDTTEAATSSNASLKTMEKQFGQRFFSFASGSPKIGRKFLKSMSEKMKSGRGLNSGSNTLNVADLTRSQSTGIIVSVPKQRDDEEDGLRCRTRSGAISQEPTQLQDVNGIILEEDECDDKTESTGFAEDNSDSDTSFEIVCDSEEVTLSFTDLLDNDERIPFEGVVNGSGSCDQIDGCERKQLLSRSRLMHATDVLVQAFHMRLEHLIVNSADYPPALTFVKTHTAFLQLTGWDIYSFPKEMDRQGVCEDRWRLTVINGPQYKLCPTYPQLMYIPKGVQDSVLEECAKFRSKGRVPCLVWVDKTHHNFMLRCAQPFTGKSGKHSAFDEHLIQSAIHAGPDDAHMIIYDARTFSAAAGNMIMGKGTEIITHYPRAKLAYLDIPNIHAVRESYDALKSLCLSSTSGKWLSSLEGTQWINYISLLIKGSVMIARYMKLQHGNALVHCSDGWDRTAQLTSLVQLMMDPYYRTTEGFTVLVDKEWLSFGHKFQHRLGHPDLPNERSPIFLQFLDCVYQMLYQFPTAFEFNKSYLLCIADHLNTGWFGTFLCNCDRERHAMSLYARSASLWAHLSAIRESLVNSDYVETTDPIYPTNNIRRLRLWEEYFLRYDSTTLAQLGRGQEYADSDLMENTKSAAHASDRSMWREETVLWVSDDKTNECSYCQQKFSPFKRKHHCRSCGHIFCHDCSKHKITIDHLGYSSPQRVCDECFRKLHGAHKTTDVGDGFLLVSSKEPQH